MAAGKEDRNRLYVAVNGLAKRANVYPGTIWIGLKKHIGSARMSDISAAQIPEALRYLSDLSDSISGHLSEAALLKQLRSEDSEEAKIRLVKMAVARFHLTRAELVQELCAAIDEAMACAESRKNREQPHERSS